MRVFISWSGDHAKEVALVLRRWLKKLIQRSDPWVSDADIAAGVPWFDHIRDALKDAHVGIICVTRERLESRWVYFEAGAVAREFDRTRTIPLLVDLADSEVGLPLSLFQGVGCNREGLLRIARSVNERAGSGALDDVTLLELFDSLYPHFQQEVDEIGKRHAPRRTPPPRPTEDLLAEIVSRLAALESAIAEVRKQTMPPALAAVVAGAAPPIALRMRIARTLLEHAKSRVAQAEERVHSAGSEDDRLWAL
jgi:hypothetical protein